MAKGKSNISEKFQRQICIVNFLKQERKSSKELLNHLDSKGYSKSTSTLSNDIKSLKETGFKIDDSSKGYYSLLDDGCNELYSHFIKYQSMAIAYHTALQFSPNHMQYILFEPNALEFNIEVFNEIFKAIKNKNTVTFSHINYHRENKINTYKFQPYLLKEYQNRWYAIGKTEKGYRTFSIDRISNLEITKVKSRINLDALYDELQHVIGISFNPDTTSPEIIKLKIANSQKEYIKTTPIHKNQEIIEEGEEHFVLKLFVGNTVELHQQILKYGNRIEVLQPKNLRMQIKNEIEEMLKLYK